MAHNAVLCQSFQFAGRQVLLTKDVVDAGTLGDFSVRRWRCAESSPGIDGDSDVAEQAAGSVKANQLPVEQSEATTSNGRTEGKAPRKNHLAMGSPTSPSTRNATATKMPADSASTRITRKGPGCRSPS